MTQWGDSVEVTRVAKLSVLAMGMARDKVCWVSVMGGWLLLQQGCGCHCHRSAGQSFLTPFSPHFVIRHLIHPKGMHKMILLVLSNDSSGYSREGLIWNVAEYVAIRDASHETLGICLLG